MPLRMQATAFAVVLVTLLGLWGLVTLGQPGTGPTPELTTVVQPLGSACGMTPEQALAWSEARRSGPTVMLQDADRCSIDH